MSPNTLRTAEKYFWHVLNRYLDRLRDGSLHPYDWHKVEGAAARWSEALKEARP